MQIRIKLGHHDLVSVTRVSDLMKQLYAERNRKNGRPGSYPSVKVIPELCRTAFRLGLIVLTGTLEAELKKTGQGPVGPGWLASRTDAERTDDNLG
jgi:hypothetical protein